LLTVIACDDGVVRKLGTGWTVEACVLWSEPGGPRSIAHLPVHIDGMDATGQVLYMARVLASRAEHRVDAVLLDSVTTAGFNFVSPAALSRAVGAPVIVAYKRRPRWERIEKALKKNLPDYTVRLRVVEIVRRATRIATRRGDLYVIVWGTGLEAARRIIEALQRGGRIPEPLRFVDVYASALSRVLIQ